MNTVQTSAINNARIELSETRVAASTAQVGVMQLNAGLVARTLAARKPAGFTTPRPSAPMALYVNPDGTVCSNHRESLAFDRAGMYS